MNEKLRKAAERALEAWDETVLPVSNDGMMQERMEFLREALSEPALYTSINESLLKWASSPELVETGNNWQQGYEHARAWVHVQLTIGTTK